METGERTKKNKKLKKEAAIAYSPDQYVNTNKSKVFLKD